MRRGPEGAQARAAWYFLAPALALIGLFFFLPVGASLLLSITDFDIYALGSSSSTSRAPSSNYASLA